MSETFQPITLKSPQMLEIYGLVKKVAPTNRTVLLSGETGVGKEIIANQIQRLSLRKNRPFIAINCGAFPDNGLLQSKLFGHEKGSYTGATQQRLGLFEQTNSGTLFLDEIGEMDIEVQSMLLRSLETQEFTRLGGNKTIKVDVRIITATNKNLNSALKMNEFRSDLYYRLNRFHINIPPLRERREDILDLAETFVAEIRAEHNKPVKGMSNVARDCLYNATLPGNIRQLRNAIDSAIISMESDVISLGDLPMDIGFDKQEFLHTPESDDNHDKTIPSEILRILSKISVTEFIMIFGAIPNAVWQKLPEQTQHRIISEASYQLSKLLGAHRDAISISGKNKNEILSEAAKIRLEKYGSFKKAAASLGIDSRTLKSYTESR